MKTLRHFQLAALLADVSIAMWKLYFK